MKPTTLKGYSLNKNYTKLTIWYFNAKTQALVLTLSAGAPKGITRRERFDGLCKSLTAENIELPQYLSATR